MSEQQSGGTGVPPVFSPAKDRRDAGPSAPVLRVWNSGVEVPAGAWV